MFNIRLKAISFANYRLKQRRCAVCGNTAKLLCIKSEKPGLDRHTFECEACKHLENALVSNDPMASEGNGWATSHLHAPK